jgi:hypothetical protein
MLVPFLLVPWVCGAHVVKVLFCHGDHFLGRGELAQESELSQVVVDVQTDLLFGEVDGEVGNPQVLADFGGNGLLAVVDALLDEVVFLEGWLLENCAMLRGPAEDFRMGLWVETLENMLIFTVKEKREHSLPDNGSTSTQPVSCGGCGTQRCSGRG